MNHEKTFEAIKKLQEVEIELHRLKNALETANKVLDTQREWVELMPEEIVAEAKKEEQAYGFVQGAIWAEAKLKEKNCG